VLLASNSLTFELYLLSIAFLQTWIDLVNLIQSKIKDAYSSAQHELMQQKEKSEVSNSNSKANNLQIDKNFYSLLLTVVWFLEHDSYTNVTMNLDINFCKVFQENYELKSTGGKTMAEGIKEEDSTTFQNSPIHLMFYEKISQEDNKKNNSGFIFNSSPELSSMTWCKVQKTKPARFDDLVYNLELKMVASDVTAQFVSLEQYEQLLYVLGQKPRSATKCSGQEVLTLLNKFPTNTPDNFKEMLHCLQLPFKYNEKNC
jgi:hypothetical protein